MVKTHDTPQNTDEWMDARIGKFTGSNALKLLKYGRSDRAKAQRSSFTGNYWTKRAHQLEPQAIEAYSEAKQVEVQRPGFLTNDDFPDCLYSPDGIVPDMCALLEVKAFKEERHMSINRRNIPAEILAQVHFGKIIGEFNKMVLILFNPDVENIRRSLKIINVPTDRKLEARLRRLMSNENG